MPVSFASSSMGPPCVGWSGPLNHLLIVVVQGRSGDGGGGSDVCGGFDGGDGGYGVGRRRRAVASLGSRLVTGVADGEDETPGKLT